MIPLVKETVSCQKTVMIMPRYVQNHMKDALQCYHD